MADFPYNDSDLDAQGGVLIESLPAQGTIYWDDNLDGVIDGGEVADAANLPLEIPVSDFSLGKFKYAPPGDATGSPLTSFQFSVFDEWDASSIPQSMDINVNSLPTSQNEISSTPYETF